VPAQPAAAAQSLAPEVEPTPAAPVVPAVWNGPDEALPAACLAVADDAASTRRYVNVEDGYCLRYPDVFRLGEVLPGIANLYGPPRAPGAEPLAAGLVVRVEALAGEPAPGEVAAAYVGEQQYVGGLGTDYTLSGTTLGGGPAVLLEGPGEYTSLYVLLAVHGGKRYTLSIWPDPEQYPLVAADVAALRETVRASFSFLPPIREEASVPRR
jgi:hypothetical protein